MLTCSHCQFSNPPVHKFCQRCGEPLPQAQALRASLMPPDRLDLSPATYLDTAERYQVVTVLSQGSALIEDTKPNMRSPLQAQLATFSQAASEPSLETLQAVPDLPAATYPYLMLPHATPTLYDAWQQNTTTVLVTGSDPSELPALSSLIQSFSTAVDPLQHVYWIYQLTDLWAALQAIPQWRSSLLLADNLALDSDQSVSVRKFIPPALQPPSLSALKGFLQSLLAQPHRGAIAPLRQIRQIILTVTASETLEQLRSELTTIGEALLATPAAITPTVAASIDNSNIALSKAVTIPALNTLAQEVTTSSTPALGTSVPSTPETNTTVNLSQPTESQDAFVTDMPNEDPLEKIVLTDPLDQVDAKGDLDTRGESTMVLPMKLVSIESAGRTDVGRQRDHNEDRVFIVSSTQKKVDNGGQTTQAHSLYVLCDGMGGHAGGEVASRIATETLSAYFTEHWPHPLPGQTPPPLPDEATIADAVRLANTAIFEINEKENRAGHERMGTTLVLLLLQGTEAVVAHVGDSRLYQHSRRMGLRQVTTDHEVGQREIQRGVPHDIAYARPDAYQLTQALGPRGNADLTPSVSYLTFSEDALLLLCSDGLSDNNLVEDHLDSHIDPVLRGKTDIELGMDELITLGNKVNGHDNISAIAIRLRVSPDMSKMQGTTAPRPQQTVIQ